MLTAVVFGYCVIQTNINHSSDLVQSCYLFINSVILKSQKERSWMWSRSCTLERHFKERCFLPFHQSLPPLINSGSCRANDIVDLNKICNLNFTFARWSNPLIWSIQLFSNSILRICLCHYEGASSVSFRFSQIFSNGLDIFFSLTLSTWSTVKQAGDILELKQTNGNWSL